MHFTETQTGASDGNLSAWVRAPRAPALSGGGPHNIAIGPPVSEWPQIVIFSHDMNVVR